MDAALPGPEPKLSRRQQRRALRAEQQAAKPSISRNDRKRNARKDSDEKQQQLKRSKSEAEGVRYFIYNGLRHVVPYDFQYNVWTKGRWIGKTLIELLSLEFRSHSRQYYESAIESGRITLDGAKVLPDTILKNKQRITHLEHRHEPPVIDAPIEIQQHGEVVVVSKPSSIPIHPCGKIHHNSLTSILSHHPSLPPLLPIHRLDLLTSGLVLFATNAVTAARFAKLMVEKSCQKFYLARVAGKFPEGDILVDEPLQCLDRKRARHGVMKKEEKEEKEKEKEKEKKEKEEKEKKKEEKEEEKEKEKEKEKREERDERERDGQEEKEKRDEREKDGKEEKMEEEEQEQEKKGGSVSSSSSSSSLSPSPSPSPSPSLSPSASPSPSPSRSPSSSPSPSPSPSSSFSSSSSSSSSSPKPAQTLFHLLSYDAISNTSLVQCQPLTGRTHQIRIHLQFIGHPIANDPNYGGRLFESNASYSGLIKSSSPAPAFSASSSASSSSSSSSPSLFSSSSSSSVVFDEAKIAELKQPQCDQCQKGSYWYSTRPYCQHIWLHAFKYQGEGWSYEVSRPDWASDDFNAQAALAKPIEPALYRFDRDDDDGDGGGGDGDDEG